MNPRPHGSGSRGEGDPRDSIWDLLARPCSGEAGSAPPWIVKCLNGSNAPGDRVRLGDSATGTYVILSKFVDRYVCAEIFEARGLSDVQRERLHALGWRLEATGTSQIRPTWTVSWEWYEGDLEFLTGRAESVIGALRDVLAVPPERLRCRSWGDDGPLDTPFFLRDRDERPTVTGAPARCTDWEDLRRRLDWVPQTLPAESAVILTDRDRGGVQFMTDHYGFMDTGALDHRPVSAEDPDPDTPGNDRERRLFELGWTPDMVTASPPAGRSADRSSGRTSGRRPRRRSRHRGRSVSTIPRNSPSGPSATAWATSTSSTSPRSWASAPRAPDPPSPTR